MLDDEEPLMWRTTEKWRRCVAVGGLRLLRAAEEWRLFRHESACALLQSVHATGAAQRRLVSPARLRRPLREYEELRRDAEGVRSTWTFYRFEVTQSSD